MHGKYSEAIGAFWGAAVFIGALTAIVLGFEEICVWLEAVLIGVCVFLIIGLILQGAVTLCRKDHNEKNGGT